MYPRVAELLGASRLIGIPPNVQQLANVALRLITRLPDTTTAILLSATTLKMMP